jgi:hypothetical protein
MRLRATVTVEYEPDPKYYDTDDPHEMARIDAENWQSDTMSFFASFTDDEFTIVVAPISQENG